MSARAPIVLRHGLGMVSSPAEVERRVRVGLYSWRRSQRKVGARWQRALYVEEVFVLDAVMYRELES